MQQRYPLTKRIRKTIGPVMMMALVAYFLYHLVQGDRGLLAMLRLFSNLEGANKTLESITKEKTTLENRVRLLRPQSLDKDMLDEQARSQLGFVAGDETVVLQTPFPETPEPTKVPLKK